MFVLITMFNPHNVLSLSEKASFTLGNEKFVTPQKRAAEVTPDCCTPDAFQSPLDFSSVTVEQLGITPESFVKSSSGKRSCHSIAVLLKFKNSSNITQFCSSSLSVLLSYLSKLTDSANLFPQGDFVRMHSSSSIADTRVPGHPTLQCS